jgi:hypothetical protein
MHGKALQNSATRVAGDEQANGNSSKSNSDGYKGGR